MPNRSLKSWLTTAAAAGSVWLAAGPAIRAAPQPFACPADNQTLALRGCLGGTGQWVRVLFGSREAGVQLEIKPQGFPKGGQHYGLPAYPSNTADGVLAIAWTGVGKDAKSRTPARADYCIRPDIAFYPKPEFERALAAWDTQPAASAHAFGLEFRRQAGRFEVWVDGRFLAGQPWEDAWTNAVLTASPLARLDAAEPKNPVETARFLPLDVSPLPAQAGTIVTNLVVSNGVLQGGGAYPPLTLLPRAWDVGRARWLGQEQDSASFYDPFYRRSAWDNLPENMLLRVPMRFYHTAWLLVAVDPDESPWLGVRIGRYRPGWDGSGLSFGDTNVRVDESGPEGLRTIEKVGTALLRQEGRDTAVPVYRVAIPLATGAVADYFTWTGLGDGRQDWGQRLDWFDLEFTRKFETRVHVNNGIFETKPLGPKSGALVLAVTLEKAPVDIRLESPEPGFSFYKDQNPCLTLRTSNPSDQSCPLTLDVRLTDGDGRDTAIQTNLVAPPGEASLAFPLGGLDLGWYAADFSFTAADGREVWRQPLALALLPPDTRKAGDESPYGTWWFKGAHYTEPDPDRVLPLFRKMGFRHTTPGHEGGGGKMKTFSPETAAPYGVTPSMCGTIRKVPAGQTLEDVYREFFTAWPTVRDAMIFHETALPGLGLELPYELTGAPARELPETGDAKGGQARVEALLAHITQHVAAARSVKPDVRIILGNGGTSFNTFWFRAGLPRALWDACGMETAGQTLHPEGQPTGWNLQSFWIAKRMRDFYGYTNMPLTTCYEYDYRSSGPGGLSLSRQADWYARDVLHCLAYGCPNINVALIGDCNSAYYTSRWGATGVFGRSPGLLPKPAFVALATLTLMLDQAVFERLIPTGSTSLYALEFRRGKTFVYALWSGRGSRTLTLGAGPGSILAGRDSMGRPLACVGKKGAFDLPVTESPCYLAASGPVTILKAGQPVHPDADLPDFTLLDDMDAASSWKLVDQPDEAFQNYCAYWPMVKGDITLGPGEDNAVRLTLKPQTNGAAIVGRYAILEPASGPIPLEGRPEALGVWVNGNSGWGRVFFEFTDAQGRRWTSNGWEEEPGSWDMSDWEAETSINHDGWRFLSLPLPDHYASGYYTPSFRHWRCQGDNSRTNAPAFPVAFSRLYVLLRDQVVYGADMVPVARPWVELRDLTAVGRAEQPIAHPE